jgi:hypothetical protein
VDIEPSEHVSGGASLHDDWQEDDTCAIEQLDQLGGELPESVS